MKERLIELLTGKSVDTDVDVEYVADFLLENGVIVPPCKVGDAIFIIVDNADEVSMDIVEKVTVHTYANHNLEMKFPSCFSSTMLSNVPFSVFGECVFFSHYEAEKALKERANK